MSTRGRLIEIARITASGFAFAELVNNLAAGASAMLNYSGWHEPGSCGRVNRRGLQKSSM